MSFSKMTVLGNLGRDPELKYTPQGTPVASFSICANERTRDGEKQNWYDVNVYGNSAEVVSQHLLKGDTVYVEGRLDAQAWKGRDGEPRLSMKLNTNNVQFVTKRRRDNGEQQAASAAPAAADQPSDLSDDIPF